MAERHVPSAGRALDSVRRSLDAIEAPSDFQHSVRAHYTHLLQLASKLQRMGLDDATVDRHVIGIFERYETQLLQTIAETSSPPSSA